MNHNRISTAVIGTVLAAGLSACASSNGNSSGDTSPDAGSEAFTKKACDVVDLATKGPVTSTAPSATEISADNIVAGAEWSGPDPAADRVAPPSGTKTIAVPVVTAASGSLMAYADGFDDAAQTLGWTTKVIDGKGTPAGFSGAFATALGMNPDALASDGIPNTFVGDYVAQAKERGLPTVLFGQSQDEKTPEQFDAVVPYPSIFQAVLQAYYVVCDSRGTAKVVYSWDPGYPVFVDALAASTAILKQCSGCEVLEVHDRDTATASDPTKYAADTTALLQKWKGKLGYLLTPYGLNIAAAATAVQSSGQEVKLLTMVGDESSRALVRQGLVEADVATADNWLGWAAMDQLLRVMAGKQPLPESRIGLPEMLITHDNAPAEGADIDWPTDYTSMYKKTWGLE